MLSCAMPMCARFSERRTPRASGASASSARAASPGWSAVRAGVSRTTRMRPPRAPAEIDPDPGQQSQTDNGGPGGLANSQPPTFRAGRDAASRDVTRSDGLAESALPGAAEGGLGVRVDRPRTARSGPSPRTSRHRPHRERHEVRRVGPAAVRRRGEVRRVGLHQHPVRGASSRAPRAAAAAFLKVTVPAKRQVGARGRGSARANVGVAGEAVHHPAVRRALLVEHRAARRRGRRGRGSPGSCRAAWRGRCAGGSDSSWAARPSSPVRKWSSPVSPTARTRSWARPAARSRPAPRRARPAAASRGASLGCSATPATSASCAAAASTAHRAPGRSQPICTIRVHAHRGGRGERVLGRRASAVAVGDVEVAVVVDDRVRQRLRGGRPRRGRAGLPARRGRGAGSRIAPRHLARLVHGVVDLPLGQPGAPRDLERSPPCGSARRLLASATSARAATPGPVDGRRPRRRPSTTIVTSPRTPSAAQSASSAERAAAYLLVGLGQLAAHRRRAGRRRTPRPSRRAPPRSGAAPRRTPSCAARRPAPASRRRPLPGLARQEALEAEPVDRQPGDRQRGEHRRGTGDRGHRDVRLDGRGRPAGSPGRTRSASRRR